MVAIQTKKSLVFTLIPRCTRVAEDEPGTKPHRTYRMSCRCAPLAQHILDEAFVQPNSDEPLTTSISMFGSNGRTSSCEEAEGVAGTTRSKKPKYTSRSISLHQPSSKSSPPHLRRQTCSQPSTKLGVFESNLPTRQTSWSLSCAGNSPAAICDCNGDCDDDGCD